METGIAYARRSSLAQQDNTSLPDQIRRLQAHATANLIDLHAIMWDDCETGSNIQRQSLWDAIYKLKCVQCPPTKMPENTGSDKWLTPCECGQMQGLDVLMVWDFKRFGRNSQETTFLCLEVLDKLDKRLMIVDGDLKVDTKTPIGRFMLRLMASMAELDREEMMAKMNRGIAYVKQTTHKYAVGGIPYGFKSDYECKMGSNLVPRLDPREALKGEYYVLKYIWVLKHLGYSYRQIARKLNADGVRARGGGLWHLNQVFRVLSEKSYEVHPQAAAHVQVIKQQAAESAVKIREEQLAKSKLG